MKSSLERCEPANAVVKSCFSDMVYDVVHCWELVDVVGTIQVAVMHPCNAPRCTATNALASHSPPLMVRSYSTLHSISNIDTKITRYFIETCA